MNTKLRWIAAAVLTAGGFYVYGFRTAPGHTPADLRDAVADNSAIGQLGGDRSDIAVPEPKAPAAESAWREQGPVKSIFFRGEERRSEEKLNKGAGRVPVPVAGLDKAAANALSRLPGVTPYDKVKALFESGVPATQADLTGIRLGRVFFPGGEVSLASFVGVMETVPPPAIDGGPLFPPEQPAKKFVFWALDSRDSDVIAKADEAGRRRILGEFEDQKYEMVRLGRTIAGMYALGFRNDMSFSGHGAVATVSYNGISIVVEERKAMGYIVEKWAETRGPVYSYYFTDVTPR